MTLRTSIFSLVSAITLVACGGTVAVTDSNTPVEKHIPIREHSVQSVMWQQNAAEYRALYYQAFNLATLRLDAILANPDLKGKKLAIITDIDETVLDNSPYAATMIAKDLEYVPESWTAWVNLVDADPLPGAKVFLDHAHKNGVRIFYVSNRTVAELPATLENLKKVEFPNADKNYMLFKDETSSKEERFNKIREDYTVVLYLGDNLSDFTSKFRATSTKERNELADELRDKFGMEYIVLPNASYGDWEDRGIYQGRHDWTPVQKDSIRRASLRGGGF